MSNVKPGHNYSEEKGNVYAALKFFSLFGMIPPFIAILLTGKEQPMLVIALFIYTLIFPLICAKIHLLVRKI